MITGRAIRIVRRPNLPLFEGLRSDALNGLLAALAQRNIVAPLVADLTLGEWRSHELAQSCFGQMGMAWPFPAPSEGSGDLASGSINPVNADGKIPEELAASAIGHWIDDEGRGDVVARGALALAEEFLGGLGTQPLTLVVFIPRFGIQWSPESAAFLRYLAHAKRPGDRLVLVGDRRVESSGREEFGVLWSDAPDALPLPASRGLGALVPGAVGPATRIALGIEGHALRGGWTLVPPEWRRPPVATPRLEFDSLAAAPVERWLRAYAQVHGNNYFVDPWFLYAEASCQLAAGGHDIALRLMDHAATCAQSTMDRALLQTLARGFRIAVMRYREAIEMPDPSPALPPALRGAMLMTKGWGLVMTRQAERAEPYMQAAREILGPILHRNRQFLYLLNISALNRLNLGDFNTAMALEKEIEADLNTRDDRDCALRYVNSINIARLYRRSNQLDLAERYYRRAFDTTNGARTESDLVYTNVCMGRLDAARSRFVESFEAWLRASIHWLSSNIPEALGWRVLLAILGRKSMPAETSVEEVAEALSGHLRGAASAAGVALDPGACSALGPPAFVRADRAFAGDESTEIARTAVALGARGFSIITTAAVRSAAYSGPQYESLAGLVTAIIASLTRAPEVRHCSTILVDDRLGQEMATSRNQLLATCLRLSVEHARFNDEEWRLSAAKRTELLDRAAIYQGPAVADFQLSKDQGSVRFKRYLPSRSLTDAEVELVAACGDSPTIASLCSRTTRSRDEVIALVYNLAQARIVDVTLNMT